MLLRSEKMVPQLLKNLLRLVEAGVFIHPDETTGWDRHLSATFSSGFKNDGDNDEENARNDCSGIAGPGPDRL